MLIGDGERGPAQELASTDPGDPERVVARRRRARPRRGRRARCATAARRVAGLGRAGRRARAAALLRAAAWMRERRLELAALEVRECAKPWPEADADVCEAIDFLEYYARGAIELDAGRRLLQVPGERNELRYVAARRRRGDRAVELPARDPVRDDGGRAGDRQRGGAQARRAVARVARCGSCRRCAPRACPPAAIVAAPRRGRRRRRARAPSRVQTIAFTGSQPVGLEIIRAARRGRARPAPPQARRRRDGRQELRDRRRRRRPRRGGAGDRLLGVRLRRPEVLGGRARARPRGDRRRADRAASPAPCGCSPSARPTGSATDVPPLIERDAQERVRPLRALAAADGPDRRPRPSGARRAAGSARRPSPPTCRPARRVLEEEIFGPLLTIERVRDVEPRATIVDAPAVRAHRRAVLPRPGDRRATSARRTPGRQPLRQPRDHRRDGRPPAVRRQPPVGQRREGRRPRLPAAVRRAARASPRTRCATGSWSDKGAGKDLDFRGRPSR